MTKYILVSGGVISGIGKGVIDAASAEFDPNAAHPVIIFMPEISKTHMGGTMRLGLRPTVLEESAATWSIVRKLYGGNEKIWERHRHRYEVNPQYVDRLVESGMMFVGKDEKGERMQLCELKTHPFFIGLQAPPEFCTRPLNPSPPFLGFIAASCGPQVFSEQLAIQEKTFVPPHPAGAMVSEDELKSGSEAVSASRAGENHEGGEQHMKVVQKVNKDF